MAANTPRKLAKLTPEQDHLWTTLMAICLNDGMSDEDADAEAWAGLLEDYPELAQFDGAEA